MKRWILGLVPVLVLVGLQSSVTGALQLTTGEPIIDGGLSFTLWAPDGTPLHYAMSVDKDWDGKEKARQIKNNIDAEKLWQAERPDNDNKLTFYHKEKDQWVPVDTLEGLVCTTGEFDTVEELAAVGGLFDFGVGGAFASGFDADGLPSFVDLSFGYTVAGVETVIGDSLIPLALGDTSESVVSLLTADLIADGVKVRQDSTTHFWAMVPHPNSFMAFQITDTDVFVDGASASIIPEPSTFIIWSLLGAVSITVGWWRRRRKGV